MSKISFDILINEAFVSMCTDASLSPIDNKHVLSIVNDFELGKWRYERFLDYLWNNIDETALSKKERDALIGEHRSALRLAAQNLRLVDKDEKGKGSEIAEILLYGVMKDHFHALPVVPKIFYKQNVNDNVKGADSVHIVISENGADFSLWFGEAKFYKTLYADDMDKFVSSVRDSLSPDKIKKENTIITNLNELDLLGEVSNDLRTCIKETLSGDKSLDYVFPKVHIPIMVLHECSITKSSTSMSDTYKESIIDFHKKKANEYFAKQLGELKDLYHYDEVTFHLILFPVPDKKVIVDEFIAEANNYRRVI